MAQQQTQFEALVAALQQTIAAQGQTGSQLAEAARAIADASTRMATGTTGTSGTSFDTGSRVLKGPDVFAPGTLDEEVSSWQDWAFIFKNYVGFMDPNYLSEFSWAESHDGPIKESEYVSGSDTGRRAVKLYSVLSSYLKNRPLKILRSVLNNDGFEVWRRLTVELQPTSRSRSLAMAQALVSFPSMSKGASLYDYVLTYEKLVDEYEKWSGLRYDPNLKIGTLLKGIPNDLKRTLLFDMDDKTTYEQMRSRLLEYERSSQTWSAENILSSLSVQSHTKHKEYHGPIPMEIDRIEGKGKGKGKGKDGKGKGKGGKGKGKSSGAEKEEEKVEKEKVSTLDKWVRKVTAEKVSLVEKEKDLRVTSVARQDISPQSVTRTLGKEKVKERASGMFMESMSSGTKIMNNGMTNGRIGTTMKEISKANILRKRQVHRVSQA